MNKGNVYESIIESLRYLYEDIVEIDLNNKKTYVWYNKQRPELERNEYSLGEVMHVFYEYVVYELDQDLFRRKFSDEALWEFVRSGDGHRRLEIRYRRSGQEVFNWYEIHMISVENEEPTILVFAKNIDSIKRKDIIVQAIEDDYDYIMYLNANTRKYFMYDNSRDKSAESYPRRVGQSYDQELERFVQHFMPQEQWDATIAELSIDHIEETLKVQHEFVYYGEYRREGKTLYKKMRVIPYDREDRIYLLTWSDVTALRESENQKRESVIEACRAAEEASKVKSEFLSKISNDIRTPLSTIMGMTAIAGTHIDNQGRVTDALNKISVSGRHLLNMVNEILDMSRMRYEKLEKVEEDFILELVIKNVLGLIHMNLDEKEQDLILHVEGIEHERVVGDPDGLTKALYHIIDNAIKFTQQGGKIEFTIREYPSKVAGYGYYEIRVRDNGEGIPEEVLGKIFQPFMQRGEISQNMSGKEGMGLGLTIAQTIILRMQGKIKVESELGEGTCVTAGFYLKLDGVEQRDTEEFYGHKVIVAGSREELKNLKGVFDNLDVIMDTATTVSETEHKLRQAQEKNDRYLAVFLTDGMEGGPLQSVKRLRTSGETRALPIVLIKQQGEKITEVEARTAGFSDVLRKPVFGQRITELLREYYMKQQNEEYMDLEAMRNLNLDGKKILLADSNTFNREIMEEILRYTRAEVMCAKDGQEAVSMFEQSAEQEYDLAIFEVKLAELDGCSAAKKIREMHRGDARVIPIFGLTTSEKLEGIINVKQAGMNEYLLKPISIMELMSKLNKWMK